MVSDTNRAWFNSTSPWKEERERERERAGRESESLPREFGRFSRPAETKFSSGSANSGWVSSFFGRAKLVLASVVEELCASSSCNLTDYPGDSSSVSGFFEARRKLVYRRNFTDETDDRALKTKRTLMFVYGNSCVTLRIAVLWGEINHERWLPLASTMYALCYLMHSLGEANGQWCSSYYSQFKDTL